MDIKKWAKAQIEYKHDLNDKYRSLSGKGKPTYDGRILYGTGYIDALENLLKILTKDDCAN